ncbi:IS1 family transposase [Escherichia coli]|uniref:IS1 family transposase n=8 Tax=Escherichia coli TaxID=562 RepID=UPI003D9AA3A0
MTGYGGQLWHTSSVNALWPHSVTLRIQPGSDVIVCAEMDEQWGYVGAKSRQRWLFYAYDRIRRTVVAHIFGERTMGVGLNTVLHHFKKLRPQSVTLRIQPGSDVIVCAEMDEQWGYVGAKSRQRWLFYAYDRIRRTVVAHIFGERTLATLERLLSLLSAFEVVVWMTDGWPLYESRLKGKLHVISKRYTQRIERHNLNLRQHLARLGRKSLSFSKSVELHDKVIGHYLNIKHYQ